MSDEERIAGLATRVNRLIDEIYVINADIKNFKNKVASDIKMLAEQVQKNAQR